MGHRPLPAGSHKAISTARVVLAGPHLADRAVPAGRAAPATTALAVRADLQTTGPVDRAVQETTARADPALQTTGPVDRAVPETTARADPAALQASDQADRVVPAHGMGMPSAATSTEPPGVTAPGPGALVRPRGRTGVGRFRRRVDGG